jgi:hypothetical protein
MLYEYGRISVLKVLLHMERARPMIKIIHSFAFNNSPLRKYYVQGVGSLKQVMASQLMGHECSLYVLPLIFHPPLVVWPSKCIGREDVQLFGVGVTSNGRENALHFC